MVISKKVVPQNNAPFWNMFLAYFFFFIHMYAGFAKMAI
jgi:hypothetical protein